MEMIFNESVRTVETSKPEIEKENVENWFLVAEANSICTQLKKPYVSILLFSLRKIILRLLNLTFQFIFHFLTAFSTAICT